MPHNLEPRLGGGDDARPDRRRHPGPLKRAVIYRADAFHVSDGVASDGSGRPLRAGGVRRVFTPEQKLSILAEYDAATEAAEKGAILRREVL